jgi:hypothetical protein
MNTPPPNLGRGRQRMNENWVGAKDMDRVSEWVAEEDFYYPQITQITV